MERPDDSTSGVIAAVQKLGHHFSYNETGGVIAICHRYNVQVKYLEYIEKVREGVISASDKVILLVQPTLTFAEFETTLRPIHCGILGNKGCQLVKEILKKMYGGPLAFDFNDESDRGHLLNMRDMLFRRDERIYVPFSGSSTPLWQLYLKFSEEEAMSLLLSGIPTL